MKVYIVEAIDYDSSRVVKVFSSLELATKYKEYAEACFHEFIDEALIITEREVSEEEYEIPKVMFVCGDMFIDGNTWYNLAYNPMFEYEPDAHNFEEYKHCTNWLRFDESDNVNKVSFYGYIPLNKYHKGTDMESYLRRCIITEYNRCIDKNNKYKEYDVH